MAASTGMVPIERFEFSSHDAEETAEFLRDMYVDNHTRFHGVIPDAEFSASAVAAGELGANWVRNPMDFEITTAAMDGQLLFYQVKRGRLRMHGAGEDIEFRAGHSFMYPFGGPVQATMRDTDLAVVSLPLRRIEQVAAEHTDTRPGDVRFASMAPVSPAMNRYFANVLAMIHGDLAGPEPGMANPLVYQHLLDTAAAGALATFPNTTMAAAPALSAGHVGALALRRAVAYIEAHAAEPITLSQIAAAAGVGPRALQYGFQSSYDTSPMGYLHRVRLARAHRDLHEADPASGATVAGIAAAWGFAKPGRFATYYRAAYGRLPSHTLRD
jgi:AraC-like DNA-binding protein